MQIVGPAKEKVTVGGNPIKVLQQFLSLSSGLKYPIEKEKFEAFCRANFENVPYLKNVSLPDFKARPRFLDLIQRKDHLLARRSQPPLFVQMVKDYFNVTRNVETLRRWVPFMDKEMQWWMNKRNEKVTIRTQTIVPVDLNVYMALNMKFLADSHALLGNHSMSDWYRDKYRTLLLDIHDLFWNQNEGIWFDYDLKMEKQRTEFYPSNVFPLLLPEMQSYADRVYNYLEKLDVYRYPGGVPSTFPVKSTEQWDFPNVWAPTQHLFIQSLFMSQHPGLQQRALDEANKFITTVFNGLFNPQKGMPAGVWEKYDARSSDGKPGGGGEYVVQEGFGWTNGVVMDLINLLSTHHASPRFAATGNIWSGLVSGAATGEYSHLHETVFGRRKTDIETHLNSAGRKVDPVTAEIEKAQKVNKHQEGPGDQGAN
ncbi:alpha,alpha-trehalase [Ancylostoma ceylanicum]|uniref:Trehalase n=1 Tax=Ancylostoma ceylanicum TaxID=53326 RepID=A0A0D6LWY8_9BILA|nr:alpha,alpha-trehalase [Ancylostoma ceylanicum]